MQIPVSEEMIIEEFFIELRDSTFVPKVLNTKLLVKAKQLFDNELINA